jgi:transposase
MASTLREKTVIARQIRRGQVIGFFEKVTPCLIGLEACATSHHWARELKALGHDVRLTPSRRTSSAARMMLPTRLPSAGR